MVCTADDLLGWKDFPKGLRVLLLDEDETFLSEMKSKLEEMEYIVSTFCNENEALTAVSSKPESFHVAIIEVNTGNGQGSFKLLETVKDLPIIMTSSIHCLSTVMKCIALGAAEFLQKPLSEDKLRNLWQHVVHKAYLILCRLFMMLVPYIKNVSNLTTPEQAYNAGGSAITESLKPVKEAVASMIQLQIDTNGHENQKLLETEKFSSAPSTPQLKQGSRSLNTDNQDQTDTSNEKDNGEQEGESKFVETTCNNIVPEELTIIGYSHSKLGGAMVKEEGSPKSLKTESSLCSHPQSKNVKIDSNVGVNGTKKAPSTFHSSSCGTKKNRKKLKVDWTSELHKQFVQAVEQLGVEQAIPSRILELMKVEGLTRHNVASHLQKYRMHRKHIEPKEDDRRWQHPRDLQRIYPQKPVMAYPTYHSNHATSANQFYPVWGHPGTYPWSQPGYPAWQPPVWKTYPGMHLDAWGCPVMPPSQGPSSTYPQVQTPSGYYSPETLQHDGSTQRSSSLDNYPAEEEIDKVVKEALNRPWLPLPLGLRPPSTESVLSELRRQGICNIPPSK
ncbi:hypothetical protein GIB67_027238 [Kingdonia uniflora]|uniref:Two-component response regulator-like APRR2 n=1 Tax=Kingdonia uniflora TaxID=39325 RepID=A0A7J7KYL1_9MAGN|nr:hypothetical protein GIB67_027238 [Kingdonia uniflora]